ncbi:aldehyde dehydrogenase family protein [Streptosporangium sp. NPDC006007]|uniref:aldehyde dehydrogenase family protein n=1 Tax=Streptosporangium sp. NPDC006007 TaxID=3154575 RepID=UPI0033AAF634
MQRLHPADRAPVEPRRRGGPRRRTGRRTPRRRPAGHRHRPRTRRLRPPARDHPRIRRTGRATTFARRLRTGQVDVNGAQWNFSAPFGGYKQSGTGRELGPHGIADFCEIKSIQL